MPVLNCPTARQLVSGCLLFGFSLASHALTFAEAIQLAETHSPQIKADSERIDSATALTQSAGQLPDPKLEAGIQNLPVQGSERYSLVQDPMTMRTIGLMQEFPNQHKRAAETASAQAQAAIAVAQKKMATLDVLRGTALAWIDRQTAEKELRLIGALRRENQLFTLAVHAQVAAGKAPLSDALVPRQEAVAIDNLQSELNARRSKAIALLSQWIGKAASEPLEDDVPEWAIQPERLYQTLQQQPSLKVFDSRFRAIDAGIDAAKADKIPDWSVEMMYQERAPQFGNMVSFQVTVGLPVFPESRQNPEIAARLADREALESEQQVALREHRAELEADLAEYQRLLETSGRQEKILLPLADEKVSLMLAEWKTGKTSLADLAAARRERIDAELKNVELDGDLQRVAARLHYTNIPGEMP